MPKGQRNKPVPFAAPAPVEVIAPVAIVEPVEAPAEVVESAPVEVIAAGPAEVIGEAAPEPVVEATPAAAPVAPTAPAEDLSAYAKRIERVAQPLAVCIITHPDAVDGAIFEGVYAGIRLVNGPEMSARLSDGSTI